MDPEVMTKSETEHLGEVSDIVMPEGSNSESLVFSGISGVSARKLDFVFMTSQTVAGGDNSGVTWKS